MYILFNIARCSVDDVDVWVRRVVNGIEFNWGLCRPPQHNETPNLKGCAVQLYQPQTQHRRPPPGLRRDEEGEQRRRASVCFELICFKCYWRVNMERSWGRGWWAFHHQCLGMRQVDVGVYQNVVIKADMKFYLELKLKKKTVIFLRRLRRCSYETGEHRK